MPGFGETIKQFGVKLSLDFDKKKFTDAREGVEKFGSELRHFSFEIAGAATALFGFAALAGMNARKLTFQSDIIGVNTEELQRYAYAAKVAAGVTEDEFAGSLETLSGTLMDVRRGNVEAGAAILSLGKLAGNSKEVLDIFHDRTKNSMDLFKAIVPAFSKINDAVTRSKLTSEIFGTNKLVPFLKLAPEQIEKLAKEGDKLAVVNKAQVAATAKLWENYVKLGAAFEKISYTIGYKILRVMKPYLDQLVRWLSLNQDLIAQNIGKAFDALADALPRIVTAGKQVIGFLSGLVTQMGGTKEAVKTLFEAFLIYKGITLGANLVTALAGLIAIGPEVAAVTAIVAGLAIAIHDLYVAWELWHGRGTSEDLWTMKAANMVRDLSNPGHKDWNNAESWAPESSGASATAGGGPAIDTYAPVINIDIAGNMPAATVSAAVSQGLADHFDTMWNMKMLHAKNANLSSGAP